MEWYFRALTNYAGFSGRARRKEFWMFSLFNFGIGFLLAIIDVIMAFATGMSFALSGLYSLAVLIPSLAVSVRRLHDTDRSGFWVLLGFIPVIGTIVLLIFAAEKGSRRTNRYGPSPKRRAVEV